jgi:hypothetical protein
MLSVAQSDVVRTVICSFFLFAFRALGAVAQSTIISLTENLTQMTDGTLAQTALLCEDGSHATLEHTSIHLGDKARTWSCSTNSTERNAAILNKQAHPNDFDLCTAICTTYCDKPM